jgi:hypothetical protein
LNSQRLFELLRGVSAAGDMEVWRLCRQRFANKPNKIVGEVRGDRVNRHMTRTIKEDRILVDLHMAKAAVGRIELKREA